MLQKKINYILEKFENTICLRKDKKIKPGLIEQFVNYLRPIFRESIANNIIFMFTTILIVIFYSLNYIIVKDRLLSQNLYEYINIAFLLIFILIVLKLYYLKPSDEYSPRMVEIIESVCAEIKINIKSKIEAKYLYMTLKERQNSKPKLDGVSTIFIFILLIFCNVFVSNFKDIEISGYTLGWIIILGIILGIINIYVSYRYFIYKVAAAALNQIIYDFESGKDD
ncbi:hypothetical protein [Francisella sp. SYW-2]|uniref:hypothetical protein n=1 Tax=Francisella sp. SYW-2 TaxID=2610886 RepID=UPI00123CD9AF|nr:hypothetical protein [Francisella sp. SYW-2]